MKTFGSYSKRGFTLIEIMIAMSIFTVIIVAVYSSWAAIVRGAKSGQDAAAAAQRSRIAIRTIEDALLTTQLYTENLRYYSFLADTSDSKFAWLSLTARLPETFPGSGLFGDQVVRRVTFSIVPDADGTAQLLMTQIPLLLVTNSDVSAYPITLAKDVSLFVLEFWDTTLNEWTDELITTNVIPKKIRVSLGIGHAQTSSSQPSEIVSRIIAMPSIAVGADIQQPRQGGAPGGLNPGAGGQGGQGQGGQGGRGGRGEGLRGTGGREGGPGFNSGGTPRSGPGGVNGPPIPPGGNRGRQPR
ncbi:MAG: prepilin-type N-terminal cleavage/methylation domain-containing protein [Verrucomicrobiota bacterium]